MLFAALLGLKFAYGHFRFEVNSILLAINQAQLYPFVKMGIGKTSQAYEIISEVQPGTASFNDIIEVFAYTGRFTKWVLLILVVVFSLIMFRTGIGSTYSRRFTMEKLIEEGVNNYTCLAPIVGRNILDEDPNKGPWRVARQPIQFALEKELLISADKGEVLKEEDLLHPETGFPVKSTDFYKGKRTFIIDEKKAEAVFTEQLGGQFKNTLFTAEGLNPKAVKEFPFYMQGLIAVFVAHGQSKAGREEAHKLLDQMNLSFQEEGRVIKEKGLLFDKEIILSLDINIEGAFELIEKYADSLTLYSETEIHSAYKNTWLMALYVYARKKGLLPTSHFIWLRPTSELYWYTLDQVGGNTAWWPGAGTWNHYLAEEQALRVRRIPVTLGAVEALETALRDTGWLAALPEEEDID